MGVGGQRHALVALPPGKRSGTHCMEGCVGTRASVENLASTGIRPPDRPARSESLYRLSYRGPPTNLSTVRKPDRTQHPLIKSQTFVTPAVSFSHILKLNLEQSVTVVAVELLAFRSSFLCCCV
jgi:hypothetical protein